MFVNAHMPVEQSTVIRHPPQSLQYTSLKTELQRRRAKHHCARLRHVIRFKGSIVPAFWFQNCMETTRGTESPSNQTSVQVHGQSTNLTSWVFTPTTGADVPPYQLPTANFRKIVTGIFSLSTLDAYSDERRGHAELGMWDEANVR